MLTSPPMNAACRTCRPRRGWLTAALVLALGATAGCGDATGRPGGGHGGRGGGKGHGGKGGEQAKALTVKTVTLHEAQIERHYRTSGTLAAIRSAQITAVQPAIIRDIAVDEGDTVKAGQVLAKLDGKELGLQAGVARVQLDNLERELTRLESASSVISAEEIAQQRNAVDEARAALRLSKHQAKQTTVRAPFNGTIVERHVDEGNLATTATALFSLADISTLELFLHLPERDAASVKVGTQVEITLVDDTTFNAAIARRAPIVDATTGTVKFTVRTSEYPQTAVPGAFARARVLVDRRDAAPSLLATAIFRVDGEPHVFVIEEGKARRKAVKTGLEGGGRIEVLEGIGADDVVVAEGSAGVTEGMPLTSEPDPQDGAQPTAERSGTNAGA